MGKVMCCNELYDNNVKYKLFTALYYFFYDILFKYEFYKNARIKKISTREEFFPRVMHFNGI